MTKQNREIGAAVAEFRENAGWTQSQLAERLGLGSAQIVSSIERGERALKAVEAMLLAEIFKVSFSELVSGTVPAAPSVYWRDHAVVDVEARRCEEAQLLLRCRRYAEIEELTGSRRDVQLPAYSLEIHRTRFEDMEAWAQHVRNALELGSLPAKQLRTAMEETAGVKVFVSSLGGGSGAATWGDFGPAVLENTSEPLHRRAYSVAHELFHLLTWESVARRAHELSTSERERYEQLADAFASALLMPLELVHGRLKEMVLDDPAWYRLLPVAAAFAVSPPALVWRLVNIGRLSKQSAERLLAVRRERAEGCDAAHQPPLPRRFALLAFRAWAEGRISIGKLAEVLETTVGMLSDTLSEYDLDLEHDVASAADLPA